MDNKRTADSINLININNAKVRQSTGYADEDIILIDNINNLVIPGIVKLDLAVMVLCLKGNARINIGGQSHDMNPNDLLLCKPTLTLGNSLLSKDFESRCFCISAKLFGKIITESYFNWDIGYFLDKNPVLHLDEEESKMIVQDYEFLRSKFNRKNRFHYKEMIHALIQAYAYEIGSTIDRFLSIEANGTRSADILFKNFINLISNSYPKNRSVSYYSDLLHITPKYLSAICLTVSGKTASSLIQAFVLKDIKNLLEKSRKSIKEIAEELDFPNLSVFGRYVRKHLGSGPRKYRDAIKQHLINY